MIWRLFLLGLCCGIGNAMACCLPDPAQTLAIDGETEGITSDGITVGCSVKFATVYKDDIYRRGEATAIAGALFWTLLGERKCFGLGIKVVGLNYDKAGNVAGTFKIPHSYVIDGKTSSVYQPDSVHPEFQPPYNYGVYGAVKAVAIFGALQDGALRMGFNREVGGIDVVAQIKMGDQKKSLDLSICYLQIADRMRSCVDAAFAK
jgi:hypothetical protein